MPLTFLAFFLLFLGTANLIAGRVQSKDKELRSKYLEKESEANSIKKVDPELIPTLTISNDVLASLESLLDREEDEAIMNELTILNQCLSSPMMNFTNQSNTDLKLKYGTANLSLISEYDNNYVQYITSLSRLTAILLNDPDLTIARQLSEHAIAIGSDISLQYETLGRIYISLGMSDKIDYLMNKAESLTSLSKESIILKLCSLVKDNNNNIV